MTASSRALLALLLASAGCGGEGGGPTPDFPGTIRGVAYDHPPTAADRERLAAFGRIVAVVRPDSVILLESELAGPAAYEPLGALPGVVFVGRDTWTSDTAGIEVFLTRRDGDLGDARATFRSLGGTITGESAELGSVWGTFPAYRLSRLNELGGDYEAVYSEVQVVIDVATGALR